MVALLDPFAKGTNSSATSQTALHTNTHPSQGREHRKPAENYRQQMQGKLGDVSATSSEELQDGIYGEMAQSLGRAAAKLEMSIAQVRLLAVVPADHPCMGLCR